VTSPKLVYVGYPSLYSSPPSWVNDLCKEEQQGGEDYPYLFFLSGGVPTPRMLGLFEDKTDIPVTAQKISSKAAFGPSRLVDPLLSMSLADVWSAVQESPDSPEFRILLDLWAISRSYAYLLDMNVPGRGSTGIGLSYASGVIPVMGVCDSSIVDPWYQYFSDVLVKSPSVSSSLRVFVPDC